MPPEALDARISEIRIQGIRSLEDVTLPLDGLKVLIGTNGSGKSSLIEACEILSRIPKTDFTDQLMGIHGGFFWLRQQGAQRIQFAVKGRDAKASEKDPERPFSYELSLIEQNGAVAIERERLDYGPMPGKTEPLHVIRRSGASIKVFDPVQGQLIDPTDASSTSTILSGVGIPFRQPARELVAKLLSSIQVHLPFDVRPAWALREQKLRSHLRESELLQPAETLSRYGKNLANAYHSLRNDGADRWEETLELIQMGLGEAIQEVVFPPDPSGGAVALALRLRGLRDPVPAAAISEGTLAYLAHVALYRLRARPALLAFDEPEVHLHPRLLARVVSFYESLGRQQPVLLATHSDALLDALSDPVNSVILCSLDSKGRTVLTHPDAEALTRWRKNYAGFAELRAGGHEAAVFRPAGDTG